MLCFLLLAQCFIGLKHKEQNYEDELFLENDHSYRLKNRRRLDLFRESFPPFYDSEDVEVAVGDSGRWDDIIGALDNSDENSRRHQRKVGAEKVTASLQGTPGITQHKEVSGDAEYIYDTDSDDSDEPEQNIATGTIYETDDGSDEYSTSDSDEYSASADYSSDDSNEYATSEEYSSSDDSEASWGKLIKMAKSKEAAKILAAHRSSSDDSYDYSDEEEANSSSLDDSYDSESDDSNDYDSDEQVADSDSSDEIDFSPRVGDSRTWETIINEVDKDVENSLSDSSSEENSDSSESSPQKGLALRLLGTMLNTVDHEVDKSLDLDESSDYDESSVGEEAFGEVDFDSPKGIDANVWEAILSAVDDEVDEAVGLDYYTSDSSSDSYDEVAVGEEAFGEVDFDSPRGIDADVWEAILSAVDDEVDEAVGLDYYTSDSYDEIAVGEEAFGEVDFDAPLGINANLWEAILSGVDEEVDKAVGLDYDELAVGELDFDAPEGIDGKAWESILTAVDKRVDHAVGLDEYIDEDSTSESHSQENEQQPGWGKLINMASSDDASGFFGGDPWDHVGDSSDETTVGDQYLELPDVPGLDDGFLDDLVKDVDDAVGLYDTSRDDEEIAKQNEKIDALETASVSYSDSDEEEVGNAIEDAAIEEMLRNPVSDKVDKAKTKSKEEELFRDNSSFDDAATAELLQNSVSDKVDAGVTSQSSVGSELGGNSIKITVPDSFDKSFGDAESSDFDDAAMTELLQNSVSNKVDDLKSEKSDDSIDIEDVFETAVGDDSGDIDLEDVLKDTVTDEVDKEIDLNSHSSEDSDFTDDVYMDELKFWKNQDNVDHTIEEKGKILPEAEVGDDAPDEFYEEIPTPGEEFPVGATMNLNKLESLAITVAGPKAVKKLADSIPKPKPKAPKVDLKALKKVVDSIPAPKDSSTQKKGDRIPLMEAEKMAELSEKKAESKEEAASLKEEQGVEDEVKKEDEQEAADIQKSEMRLEKRAEKYEKDNLAPMHESEQREADRIHKAEMEAEKIAKSEAEENLLVDPPNTDEANLGDDSEGSTPLNAGEKEILDTLSVEDGMEGVGEDYSSEDDDIDMSSLSQFAGLPESFVADQANQLMPWNEQAIGGNDVHGIQPFTEEEIAFLVLSEPGHERRRLFFQTLFGKDYGSIGRAIVRTAKTQIAEQTQKSRTFGFKWRKLREKVSAHCKKSARFRRALRGRVLAKINVLGTNMQKMLQSENSKKDRKGEDSEQEKKEKGREEKGKDGEKKKSKPEPEDKKKELDKKKQLSKPEPDSGTQNSDKKKSGGNDYVEEEVGDDYEEAVGETFDPTPQLADEALSYLLPWRESAVGDLLAESIEPLTMDELVDAYVISDDEGNIIPSLLPNNDVRRRRLFVFGILGPFGREVLKGVRGAIQQRVKRNKEFAKKFHDLLEKLLNDISTFVTQTVKARMKDTHLFDKIASAAKSLKEKAEEMFKHYQKSDSEVQKKQNREKEEEISDSDEGDSEDDD